MCNPTQIVRAYKIQLEDKQMNIHGNIESLTDTLPFAQSLKRQIRVYPKRITLDPGECQTIQIQLKNTAILPQGEFRSYLHFVPTSNPVKAVQDTTKSYTTASTAIVIQVGVAIPIIFRKSTSVPQVKIDNVLLTKEEKELPALYLDIYREGMQSTYGLIRVLGKKEGEEVIVRDMPGYAVLPEIMKRTIVAEIICEGLDTDASGKTPLTIQYINQEKGGRSEVMAQWKGSL